MQPIAARSVGSGVRGIGGSIKKLATSRRRSSKRDHGHKGEVLRDQRTKIEVPLR